MNKVFNALARQFFLSRISRIEKFMRNPIEVQNAQFEELLPFGKNTLFGKKHNFAAIKTPEQFAKNVPLSTYEDLFPYIEQMLHGEKNILWSENVNWFSKSSGTTNARSKFIPVSAHYLQNNHFKGGKDLFALYFNNYPNGQIFSGKSLGVGGSLQNNPAYPNIFFGDVSAVMMKNLPFWAEIFRTPSIETALMPDWETKLPQLAKETISENVTAIQGVPTWTIFLIKKVLEISGKGNILDVWRNLECFFHGAVAFDPYRPIFKELIPSLGMNYMEIYNASEGFFAIQDEKNSHDLLLLLDYSVFYEFIALEDEGKENPKTYTLGEVQKDKIYAMVITTHGGLWRYKIGDTVKFTSLSPYRLRIVGRTKHFINAFGEELMVENADIAIAEACKQTSAVFREYTAAPIFIQTGKKGGHEWLIEFEKSPENLEKFTQILDDTLRKVNSDYDAKRSSDIALLAPTVQIISEGIFYEWLKRKGKLGGQNKVPRLTNNREIVEEIKNLASI